MQNIFTRVERFVGDMGLNQPFQSRRNELKKRFASDDFKSSSLLPT